MTAEGRAQFGGEEFDGTIATCSEEDEGEVVEDALLCLAWLCLLGSGRRWALCLSPGYRFYTSHYLLALSSLACCSRVEFVCFRLPLGGLLLFQLHACIMLLSYPAVQMLVVHEMQDQKTPSQCGGQLGSCLSLVRA